MIIVVVDGDGEERPFPKAIRFATDECNNLQIYEGSTDRLVHVFHESYWREAGLIDDD